MGADLFPPFHDGGNWLKIANSLLGSTYPMWEQTPLQYPPLFTGFLAFLLKLFGDGLFAIKLAGVLAVMLVSLAAYPLAREIGGSWISGLVASWAVGFHPIIQEMFGWGGYPNALGLSLLLLAVFFHLKVYKCGSRKYLVGAMVFSSLTVLAHHLTTIVLFALLIGWFSVYLWSRFIRNFQVSPGILLVFLSYVAAALTLILWRVAAGPFQYIVFNPSSLTVRPFNLEAFWWIFKSESVTILFFLTSIIGAIALELQGRKVELALLLTWVIFPFAFTQSWILGIALDPKRFPLFSIPPLAVLSSVCVSLVDGRFEASITRIKSRGMSEDYMLNFELSLKDVMMVSLLIIWLFNSVLLGFETQQAVFEYYHYITDYAYRDRERLDAINWIRMNTPENAVIVADDALGRWVEGLAVRRVLMRLPPFQAFMVGEVERYKAADLILNSNVELRNEFVRLRDGTPYWTKQTPWFAISKGSSFKDLIYTVDAYNRVKFSYAGNVWIEAPYAPLNFSMLWLRKPSAVSAVMKFTTLSLEFSKTLSLKEGSAEALLNYQVKPRKEVVLQSFNISLWVPSGFHAKFLWYEVLPIEVEVEGEPIFISSDPSPDNVVFGPDPETGQLRLLLSYVPSDDEFNVSLRLNFPSAVKSTWSVGVEGFTSDEAIERYNVTHIAVAKPLYDMERFYSDPRLRQVYVNAKISVFEVSGVGGCY